MEAQIALPLSPQDVVRSFRAFALPLSKSTLELVLGFLQQDPLHASESLTRVVQRLSELQVERKLMPADFTQKLISQLLNSFSLSKNYLSTTSLIQDTLRNAIVIIQPAQYLRKTAEAISLKELVSCSARQQVRLFVERLKSVQRRCQISEFKKGEQGKVVLLAMFSSRQNLTQREYVFQNCHTSFIADLKNIRVQSGYLIPNCCYLIKAQKLSTSRIGNIQVLQPVFNKLISQSPYLTFQEKVSRSLCSSDSLGSEKNILMVGSHPNSSVLVLPNFTINQQNIKLLYLILEKLKPAPVAVFILLSACKSHPLKVPWIQTPVFIVPHPQGPGPNILPKIPLQNIFVQTLGKGSKPQVLYNPARVSIMGNEILFICGQFQQRTTAESMYSDTGTTQFDFKTVNKKLVESVIGQGGIAFLSQKVQPFFVGMEAYLRFERPPRYLVFSDKFSDPESYQWQWSLDKKRIKYAGVFCGNFDQHQSFSVFYPVKQLWQFSQV